MNDPQPNPSSGTPAEPNSQPSPATPVSADSASGQPAPPQKAAPKSVAEIKTRPATAKPGAGKPKKRVVGAKPNAPKPRKRKIDIIKSKFGGFLFQLITLALFLTALGIWGYQQVLKQVLGRFDLLDWQAASVTLYGAPNAIIIDPVRTEDFLRPDTVYHDTLWPYSHRFDTWPLRDTLWWAGEMRRPKAAAFEAWQLLGTPDTKNAGLADYFKDWLFQHKISAQLVEEPALTALPANANLLILPGCLLLSNEEKLGIKNFVARGGRLLMCWSAGCRDETGAWSGYDFLEQLVGGRLAGVATDTSGGTAFVLNGNGPITALLPPGNHLEFFTYNGFVALNILEPRTSSDAWQFAPYWQKGGSAAPSTPTVIAHGSYVAGKFVWFSFTPDALQPRKDNNRILDKLTRNSIDWLSGKPLVNIRVWPGEHIAGGSIVLRGSGKAEPIMQSLKSASNRGRPMDLILYPEDIPDGLELAGLDYGDLILAAADTTVIQSDTLEYAEWVRQRADRLEKITGRRPNGMLMPDWRFEDDYATGALRSGMRYVLGSPMPRFYGPSDETMHLSGWWIFSKFAPLAIMPKDQVASEEWATYGGLKGGSVFRAMDNDLRRIKRTGGTYIGILDPTSTQGMRADDLEPLLAARMDSLGFWRASTHEVITRLTGWQGLRVSSSEVTTTRLRVDVSNESDVTLRAIPFDVYFAPLVIVGVEVSSQVTAFHPSNVVWNRRTGVCTFSVPEIDPGLNAAIFMDLAPADAGEGKK